MAMKNLATCSPSTSGTKVLFSVLAQPMGQRMRLQRLHPISQRRLLSWLFTAPRSSTNVNALASQSCLSHTPPHLAAQRRAYDPRQNRNQQQRDQYQRHYQQYQQYQQYQHQQQQQQQQQQEVQLPPEILEFANYIANFVLTFGFIGSCVYVWWEWGKKYGEITILGISWPLKEYDARGRPIIKGTEGFPDLADNFMTSQRNWNAGRWWTLVSSAVSHREDRHLAFNMMAFYAYMTAGRILGLSAPGLALVGVASAASCSWAALEDWQRKGVSSSAQGLGASGLVSGLGAYVTVIAPRLRFYLFFFVPMPLWLLTSGLLAWDFYNVDNVKSSVGHAGHIGGTACGLALGIVRRVLFRL